VFQRQHHGFQRFFLSAQRLRFFGVVPDGGVFRQLIDFGQAFLLAIEVKDTSASRRCVNPAPAGGWRWR
jgi:hypothetical protein